MIMPLEEQLMQEHVTSMKSGDGGIAVRNPRTDTRRSHWCRGRRQSVLFLLVAVLVLVTPNRILVSANDADEESITLISTEPITDLIDDPTASPTLEATDAPTEKESTDDPTASPTVLPTNDPTETAATDEPPAEPTESPTVSPTKETTNMEDVVTVLPTVSPTKETTAPTAFPTSEPTLKSTEVPTSSPTEKPTKKPTEKPTRRPTRRPTEEPTETPTEKPTEIPTKAPTMSPTKRGDTISPTETPSVPSNRPSAAPSPSPPVPVRSSSRVELMPVSGLMDGDRAAKFEADTTAFLQDLFQLTVPKIDNIGVSIVQQTFASEEVIEDTNQQTRNLLRKKEKNALPAPQMQRRLEGGSLLVDLVVDGTFQPTETSRKSTDVDMSIFLDQFFTVQGVGLVQRLQTVDTQEDNDFFGTLTSIKNIRMTSPESTNGSGPDMILIGAVLAGSVAFVALFAAFYMRHRRKKGKNAMAFTRDNAVNAGNTRSLAAQDRNRRQVSNNESVEVDSSIGESQLYTQSMDESEYSASKSIGKQSSISYAFSLEHGLSTTPSSRMLGIQSDSDGAGPSPTPSYDFLDTPNSAIEVGLSPPSRHQGGRKSFDMSDVENKSDLTNPDTRSETASAVSAGSGASGLKSLFSFGAKSPSSTNLDIGKIKRDCYAPPGKLGVVIDTTRSGPVVHAVKAGSSLEGLLFPGDKIIAVDGVDTSEMTASAVTKIMARKMKQERKITVLSDVNAPER
eukprot:scaffold116117_cov52-Attheya_sp.AAC.5